MEQEHALTKEETATFDNLKAQAQKKQRDLDAINGAWQGALLLLTNQRGLPADATLSTDNTKLVVTVPDPPKPEASRDPVS